MYTKKDRDMLLVIVRRSQVMMLKKVVKEIDPDSFMFSDNVKEAYGKGFLTYSDNTKTREVKNKVKANILDTKQEKIKTNSEENV